MIRAFGGGAPWPPLPMASCPFRRPQPMIPTPICELGEGDRPFTNCGRAKLAAAAPRARFSAWRREILLLTDMAGFSG